MAYNQEMFIKIVKGNAGKHYTCTLCGVDVNPGDTYTKLNSTNTNNETGKKKSKVVIVCDKHDLKASIEAVAG